MIYTIHNVMDSNVNITGCVYSVFRMEDSVLNDPIKVRNEFEPIDSRLSRIATINAKYDTRFHHESALAGCFDFIRIDAMKLGLGNITILFPSESLYAPN